MTILWKNNASSTLAGAITTSSLTITLAAGTGALFPSPTGGDFFCCTFYDQATKTINEIVHISARTGDVLTVAAGGRAQEGTTAKAWNAGDIIANLVTAGTLDAFVQAGTGPADTSILYVGTDTSSTVNLIQAVTNPVPAGLAIGMQFNIKVANTNHAAVTVELNGGAAIAITRSDGSAMVGGNIVAGEELIIVYNGTNFTSVVPPIPQAPPQFTFYVRPDGNDNNSGFTNTSGDAFATIYGAIIKLKQRYISSSAITLRVADGGYIGGFGDNVGYIAEWNIVGNPSNPAAVVVDASGAVPPPGANNGVACVAAGSASIIVNGFTFISYYANAAADGGGFLECFNCHFTSPTTATPPIQSFPGSNLWLFGNCTFDTHGISSLSSIFWTAGGTVNLGYADFYQTIPLAFTFNETVNISAGTATALAGGSINLNASVTTFAGPIPVGPKWYASTAGGVSPGASFPGTLAGQTFPPGWNT